MDLQRFFLLPVLSVLLAGSVGDSRPRPESWQTTASAPSVLPGGVVNAASFEPAFASSAWISVLGTNLAPATRTWSESDFSGENLPTALDGVSVRINGTPGYISYVSPTQVNALVPDDGVTGVVQVQVLTSQGASQPVDALKQVSAPALFSWQSGEHKYVAAMHTDGARVGPSDLDTGIAMRPAKPGDVLMLFGNGFGATVPSHPPSDLVRTPVPLAVPVTGRIGERSADVVYSALVMPGLYQFNVLVPDVPDGDQTVVLVSGGYQTQNMPSIPVRRPVGGGIIVDHRNTDITQIPGSWIDRARQNFRMYYGHTSHGMQVTDGLRRLESQYGSRYAVSIGEYLPSVSGPLAIMDASAYDWDPDFYPTVPRVLSANPGINLVMYMWCGQPASPNWQTALDKYISDMQTLERTYPKVTFIYATGQAQEKDCPACLRHKFNEQLRQYVRANNKVLFDFGDLDAWYDGKMATYTVPNWCSTYGCTGGAEVPTEHPQWGGGDYNNPCGHATFASCDNKGRAMWWLLARVAGWDGTSKEP